MCWDMGTILLFTTALLQGTNAEAGGVEDMLLSQLFPLYTPSFLRIRGYVGTQKQGTAHCFA